MTHVVGVGASAPVGALNTVWLSYELSLAGRHGLARPLRLGIIRAPGQPFTTAGISTSVPRRPTIIPRPSTSRCSRPTACRAASGFQVASAGPGSGPTGRMTQARRSTRRSAICWDSGSFARGPRRFRQSFTTGENVGVVFTRTVTASVSGPLTPATRGLLTASYPRTSRPDRQQQERRNVAVPVRLGERIVRILHGRRAGDAWRESATGPSTTRPARRTGPSRRERGSACLSPPGSFMLDYNYLIGRTGPGCRMRRRTASVPAPGQLLKNGMLNAFVRKDCAQAFAWPIACFDCPRKPSIPLPRRIGQEPDFRL
jgi:hypothetical protein